MEEFGPRLGEIHTPGSRIRGETKQTIAGTLASPKKRVVSLTMVQSFKHNGLAWRLCLDFVVLITEATEKLPSSAVGTRSNVV